MATTPDSHGGGPGFESRCCPTKTPPYPTSMQVAKMCQGSMWYDVRRRPSTRDDGKKISGKAQNQRYECLVFVTVRKINWYSRKIAFIDSPRFYTSAPRSPSSHHPAAWIKLKQFTKCISLVFFCLEILFLCSTAFERNLPSLSSATVEGSQLKKNELC